MLGMQIRFGYIPVQYPYHQDFSSRTGCTMKAGVHWGPLGGISSLAALYAHVFSSIVKNNPVRVHPTRQSWSARERADVFEFDSCHS